MTTDLLTKMNLSAHASGTIWEQMGDPHVKSVKSRLMVVLIQSIRESGLSQKEMAERLEVSQPRISNLMKGQVSLFSCDSLIEMLDKLGISADVTFRRAR